MNYSDTIASIPGELHKPLHMIGSIVLYCVFHAMLYRARFGWRVVSSMVLVIFVAWIDESIRGFDLDDVYLDTCAAFWAATFFVARWMK